MPLIIICDVPDPVSWHVATNETRHDQQTKQSLGVKVVVTISFTLFVCIVLVKSGMWLS